MLAEVSAEVVVVGDGPAGSALAAELARLDVDVVLIGPDEPWAATYTTWVDDLDDLRVVDGASIWAHRFDQITVRTARTHVVPREYGVLDNDVLRTRLRRDVEHVAALVERPDDLAARVVVDATGWPSRLGAPGGDVPAGWQTAFGVVLAEKPSGRLGVPTMMDFSDPGVVIRDRQSVPTFAYSLPVADGWLVEETVLSATPAVEPEELVPLLASRLGTNADDLLATAIETEIVRIPMGVPPPPAGAGGPVGFGTAGGMVHPATGYSVGSSLRAAPGVAAAIAEELQEERDVDLDRIRRAVWSDAARRTRHLHDFGHDVLLHLDRTGIQRFFDTFFELPVESWSPYMRIDTPPAELAVVMTRMFAHAPWRLRSQLVRGDLRRLARLLRP